MAAESTQRTGADPLTALEVSAETKEFLHWYQSLWRLRNGPPRREDIDPLDVPNLLPSFWYYECTDDGDLLCRYAGEYIDWRWGKASVQFQRLSEILPPDRVGKVFNRIQQAMRRTCIGHGWTELLDHRSRRDVERCFAPVAGSDGKPDAVIGISLYGKAINTPPSSDEPVFVKRLGLYDPVSLELVLEVD